MKRLYLPIALAAVLISALSCDNDNPAYNRENMRGTWIVDTYDGMQLAYDDYTVQNYNGSGTLSVYGILSVADSGRQWGMNSLYYDIYCCGMTVDGSYSGLFGHTSEVSTSQEYEFSATADSSVTLLNTLYLINDAEFSPGFSTVTMRKLPYTYSSADSISGIWQFSSRNGQPFSDYRFQFLPDGQLVFFSREGENNWIRGNDRDYYSLYHDFMAVTLYDNDVFGTDGMWDVACFRIDGISPSAGSMTIGTYTDTYVLTYVSSN